MSYFKTLRAQQAESFISECEIAGIYFNIRDDELCVSITAEACGHIRMGRFSRLLEFLKDEIIEIVAKREVRGHLRLVVNR